MTHDHSALPTVPAELLDTTENDRIRTITEHAYQQIVDAGTASVIGAGRYERTGDRGLPHSG